MAFEIGENAALEMGLEAVIVLPFKPILALFSLESGECSCLAK